MAGALDVLGERWTLLLIRELLTGPKRYNDLLDALSGIGTNLLADRLKSLSNDGLITQSKLPPPAAASVYELTEMGKRLEPVLLELVRWGTRYQRKAKKSATYRATWTAVAMRAFFRPERAREVMLSCEFRVGDEVFHGAGPRWGVTYSRRTGIRPRCRRNDHTRIFSPLRIGRGPCGSGKNRKVESYRLGGRPQEVHPAFRARRLSRRSN